MNRINELREMRAKLWVETKKFLDEHRGADGWLSVEDSATYDKMEADVVKLGMEIQRLESQAHIDREVLNDMMMEAPVEKDKGITIANCLQETNKILREIEVELGDIGSTIFGQAAVENDRKSPQCLQEEAAYSAGLAYDCLNRLKRIKEGLI
jgi:hypothetical protein